MGFLYNIFAATAIPLWFFNSFAGIVGGVWLLFQGHWNIVFFGIIALFLSKLYFAISFLPYTGLFKLGAHFLEKKIKILAYPTLYIATILMTGVTTLWVFAMFLNAHSLVGSSSYSTSLAPMYLWSYGLATWPIQSMGAKDSSDAVGTNLSVNFTTLGAVWIFFAVVILEINFYSAFWGFLLSMTICLNIMFYNFFEQMRREEEFYTGVYERTKLRSMNPDLQDIIEKVNKKIKKKKKK